ncbi:hypothetical protein BVY00_01780 [bacterium G20]|nr:hypothetical protein BVY00_01780 [bacterium G20]
MSAFGELLIHKVTASQIQAFIKSPSHAVLLIGAIGSGKTTLARRIATELLHLDSDEQLQKYPYFTHLKRPDGKEDIPIDAVRQVAKILKLKTPGRNGIRRVIFIEDAHDLNEEASNALLKMLEEPAADSFFILSSTSEYALLPTITSRVQGVFVQPLSLSETQRYYADKYSNKSIENAWRLSQGTAGLMSAFLGSDKDHPLKMAIDEAKQYLHQDKYERLLQVDKLSKDKSQLALMLEALLKLVTALHHSAVGRGSEAQQKRLLASRKLVHKLQNALEANVSPKLIALELALKLV